MTLLSLKNIYNSEKVAVSYEIFPPKNDDNFEKLNKLYLELEALKKYSPELISVTYGAGGSNRCLSLDIISYIYNNFNINVMPHFTCICSQKSDIKTYLSEIEKYEIKNILALRGDEPKDITVCYRDFRYANELVEFIKSVTTLSVAVAGYPEGHIDAPDLDFDILNLKRKVDAGGEVIFTQMCFDNDKFYRYIEKIRSANITAPIVFGMLPILSFSQFEKMMSMAKVSVPKKLLEDLYKYKDNPDDIKKLGIDFATEQAEDLLASELINGLHFYTLNKAYSTSKILDNLHLFSDNK